MKTNQKINAVLIILIAVCLLIPIGIMIGYTHSDGTVISVQKGNSDTVIATIEYYVDGERHTMSHEYNKIQNVRQGDRETIYVNPFYPSIVHMIYDLILYFIIAIILGIVLFANIKIFPKTNLGHIQTP